MNFKYILGGAFGVCLLSAPGFAITQESVIVDVTAVIEEEFSAQATAMNLGTFAPDSAESTFSFTMPVEGDAVVNKSGLSYLIEDELALGELSINGPEGFNITIALDPAHHSTGEVSISKTDDPTQSFQVTPLYTNTGILAAEGLTVPVGATVSGNTNLDAGTYEGSAYVVIDLV
jgi:hypothetical protein